MADGRTRDRGCGQETNDNLSLPGTDSQAASNLLEQAGLDPAAGGYLGQKVSKPSTHVSEVVGLTTAVFILLFTFGTAIAMGIPILTAILGLSVPKWMERATPKFSIEGNEWFAEHETPAEQASALQQESEERHEPDCAE